jgi:acyl-CoA synthetase (AMP-forming)/AMP-acid ligase II
MNPNNYNIFSFIKRNAKIYGNRIALISGNERITHRQFLEKVNQLSCGLMGAGVEKGDRIAILSQNSLEYVYLSGAAAKIGAIILPINWRLDSEEIKYIISDGTPKIMFVSSEFQDRIKPLMSKIGFIKKTYALGQADGFFEAFNHLMISEGISPEANIRSDDDYVIIYTAAVEGRPRGALLSHQNVIASNLQSIYYWALTKEDVHLLVLPFFHIAGLGMVLSVMQVGGSNIIIPKFDVDLALKYIQEDKVTVLGEFPPILRTLVEKTKGGNYDLSSVRHVVGLEDHPDIIKKFEEMSGATFWSAYGQSETSGIFSLAPYFERPGSAGLPSFIVEAEIVDDYGNFVETGQTGEIVVRGPVIFKGYWNLEKENAYIFRNGWHHTGDMGSFDADGYLWYKGRAPAKELIKTGGENVYPAEVEKVILRHSAVKETVVIGVPDSRWGEAIKAICVLKQGATLTETELIEFVAARIARYKKPNHVVFTSSLPRKEDGLIDREKVKANYETV